MTIDDEKIAEEAVGYVKKHKKELLNAFIPSDIKPTDEPQSIFMAGAPGVGKTEFSIDLKTKLEDKNPGTQVLHIETDRVREWVPGYDGSKSMLFQRAASLGVEKILDAALHRGYHLILDGTFASTEKATSNIERSTNITGRITGITFIYLDPLDAWRLTKGRERKEGRVVPVEVFVDAFFMSIENVNAMKSQFGKKVILDLYKKKIEGEDIKFERTEQNISTIDSYIETKYNRDTLKEAIIKINESA